MITQARKGVISEDEMERRLMEMSVKEVELKKELLSIQETVDARLLIDWDAKVKHYLADLQEGLHALNLKPDDPAEQLEICELKRRIIESLVEKVMVDRQHRYSVTISIDLLSLLENPVEIGGGTSGTGDLLTGTNGKYSDSSSGSSSFKSRAARIKVSAVWTV